jgi:hypothetical protein
MRRIDPRAAVAVAILLALAGCVAPPAAPMIPVVPGPGKSFPAFDADQAGCRQYASSQTTPVVAAANKQAVASTLLTTALGAAIGGAAAAGEGAASGAASGAAFGTAVNAGLAGWAQPSLQQQYDTLYASCMVNHGNQVPSSVPAGTPPYGGPPPVYGPPPGYYGTPPPY